jgi:hypothetical protein
MESSIGGGIYIVMINFEAATRKVDCTSDPSVASFYNPRTKQFVMSIDKIHTASCTHVLVLSLCHLYSLPAT